MGDKTAISWTDATWNPWRGCHKVSAGCKHCYMFRDQERYGRDPNVVVRSTSTFRDPLKWKEPRKIFTCSWSDFFIEEADAWRGEAWNIIAQTPQHIYQILTKRPENIADRLPVDWGGAMANVWLGISAENQGELERRFPLLIRNAAPVNFLSLEPLLGPIKFPRLWDYGIDWVIVGGESGPNFRPMNLDWARFIRDQCLAAGVPFFYKQGSGLRPGRDATLDGVTWHQFPERVTA